MSTTSVLNDLQSRIQAGYPLLFLKTWEEDRWEAAIAELALDMERGFVNWTLTRGLEPPLGAESESTVNPRSVSPQISLYPPEHVFLLKDFHPHLDDRVVIRQLRDLLPQLIAQRQTVLIMGPKDDLPLELEKDAVRVELPLPDYDDFMAEFETIIASLREEGVAPTEISVEQTDRIVKAVLGLTANEAKKAWQRALRGRTELNDDVFTTLISEKRTLAAASDLIKFYDLEEGVNDVGGLDQLKDWLVRRGEAYTPRAREQGIPLPKGVLLLGVQGCGKSLTARATARLLSFPLIRMDIANLLSSGRGETERNMRDVLNLIESIAPVVLWLDELEKGFAGTDGEAGGDATMARLVGTLLTWMSEIRKPIFVIATANSVTGLPPELLRRGRFDELFFIDLPNYHERLDILKIHLGKRGWKPESFDIDTLSDQTEGYSGAELEQVIASAMIDAFGNGRVLSQEDLEWAKRQTVPLSVTMEEKIFQLRQWAQDRCRRATSDSRVTRLIEDEQRRASTFAEYDANPAAEELAVWKQLAQRGQLRAAIVEYASEKGEIAFSEMQADFAEFTNVSGENGLAARANPGVVIWLGLSKDLAELVCDLMTSKRLYLHPSDSERYARAENAPHLPLLAEPPENKLTRPMWLPCVLKTIPHASYGTKIGKLGRMKMASPTK